MVANDYNALHEDTIWRFDATGDRGATGLTVEKMMNLYRFGSVEVPDDFGSHIRASYPTHTVKIDALDYMTNGGGRYITPANFEAVQSFFGSSFGLTNDVIQSFAGLQENGFRLSGDRLVVSGKWLVRNGYAAEGDFEFGVRQAQLGLSSDDYVQRTFLFNTQTFSMDQSVRFILKLKDDSVRAVGIKRAEVGLNTDERYGENFDFNTPGRGQIGNDLLLEPSFDPFGLGEGIDGEDSAVDIEWVGPGRIFGDVGSTYRSSDFVDDAQAFSQIEVNEVRGLASFATQVGNYVTEARLGLLSDWERELGKDVEGRQVVYGTAIDDELELSLIQKTLDLAFLGDDYRMIAGDGNDTVFGARNDDLIEGNTGDDELFGKGGNDLLWGGEGRDVIAGQGGSDVLWGGEGRDVLRGGNGADVLSGHVRVGPFGVAVGMDYDPSDPADDGAKDRLIGGGGADYIIAGLGGDLIAGGRGNDWIDVSRADDDVFIVIGPGDGKDTISWGPSVLGDGAPIRNGGVIIDLSAYELADATFIWDYTETTSTTKFGDTTILRSGEAVIDLGLESINIGTLVTGVNPEFDDIDDIASGYFYGYQPFVLGFSDIFVFGGYWDGLYEYREQLRSSGIRELLLDNIMYDSPDRLVAGSVDLYLTAPQNFIAESDWVV